LTEFEKLTGHGGILNTSFNLHGWPIVCSPKDAITTFLKSDLDYITINDYLVWKN
jgi:carbamoyltransferase